MPTKPLSDEVILEAVRLRSEHATVALAAKAGGITEQQLGQRLMRAAQRGLDGSVPKPAPPGFVVKGTTTLYRPDGSTVLQWVRNTDEPSLQDIANAMKTAFDGFKGFGKPISRPAHTRADLCTLTPLGDLHVGMYAWEGDSGTNWDLKIAEQVIGEAVDQTVMSSEKSGLAIVLFGGDYFHADNKNNETSKSRNPLDVDGRYDKVIEVGTRLAVRIIERHLRHHDMVIVRALKGNHDEHTAVALAWFLKAWYRDEPRVTIDVDASLFFWHRFGEVMIGSTHGHETKLSKLPQVMAVRRAEDWGATKFRFCHGFHLHHTEKLGDETGGCICEVHQTITPQDTWNFGRGFLSGQSMSSITYHRNAGEVGRKRTVIMDNIVLPANDNIQQKAA